MNLSQYRELFVSESRRHIDESNSLIVQLENTADPAIIHELFRHAHSLKGMAATMQFDSIADFAHKLEDLLVKVRNGELSPTADLLDIILESNDLLGRMISFVETGNEANLPDASNLVARISAFARSGERFSNSENKQAQKETSPFLCHFRHSDSFKTIRVKTETLDKMVNISGELTTTHHRLTEQLRLFPDAGLNDSLALLSSQLRELRNEVFLARMLPFSVVTERFPRLVRTLSRNQRKRVVLSVDGSDTELDRGILESVAEPMVHILRNAVDHGIESSEEREASGKPDTGRISIKLIKDRNYATIDISDDGRGMDPARLVAKALDKGLINSDQAAAMSRQDALMLICAPGFSTAETITNVSGRGVGMDAVISAVRGFGGTFSIESTPGAGSSFQLMLPLTISIIQVLLVEYGPMTVAFPISAIDRTIEIPSREIALKNGQYYYSADGVVLPLVDIRNILGQPCGSFSSLVQVIICGVSGEKIGVIAANISGQREIFVKPLGRPLSNIGIVTGGAIMGDGRIVFVMDTGALLRIGRARVTPDALP